MKVVCVEDSISNLTKDKIYESYKEWVIIHKPYLVYLVENDIGVLDLYNKDYFKCVDEVRDERLEKLGI